MRPSIVQQVTFLQTPNLAQTAVFYEEILGLPLILDQGICRIYAVADGAFIGFCQHLEAPASDKGVILTFVSAEVDAWHQYLVTHNIPIEKPPTLNETFNIYHCFARDPAGYLIEFANAISPKWLAAINSS